MARPGRRAAPASEANWPGTDLVDSAVAVMCWDNGGKHLVGLMVVRRQDGYACFVDLPPELEHRLAALDRQFVEDHAPQLLEVVYEGLSNPVCEFEAAAAVSRKFLREGPQPAAAGTMRHIPADVVIGKGSGLATWQVAGFIVDVGEIDLTRLRHETYH